MVRYRLVVLLAVCCTSIPCAANAATLHVPGDYPTIQGAIDAATFGDAVLVGPGMYDENVTMKDGVVLTSEGGPSLTIIDGGGRPESVIVCEGVGPSSAIEGFTITNGARGHDYWEEAYLPATYQMWRYYPGGGIYCYESSPLIQNNIIVGNSASNGGGIACLHSSCPTIRDNIISSNTATGFGGGGIFCMYASPDVIDNHIEANHCGVGGGIACTIGSSPEITGNTILNNTVVDVGGGVWVGGRDACRNDRHETASPTVLGNHIRGNVASQGGGGVSIDFWCSAAISANEITGNCAGERYAGGGIQVAGTAESTAHVIDNIITLNTAGRGGGVSWDQAHEVGSLADNVITRNSAAQEGGAVYCGPGDRLNVNGNAITNNESSGSGGGVAVCMGSPLVVANLIQANLAGGYGGGIHASGYGAHLKIVNNVMVDNSTAKEGGGIGFEWADGTVVNNTILRNVGMVGGIYCREGSFTILNNIIAHNVATMGGWAGGIRLMGGTCLADYNDLWNNVKDYQDLPPGAHDMAADPLFADPTADDYHLTADSPCIDAGSNAAPSLPDTDMDGNERILGAAVDMGAYECPGVIFVAIDIKPGSYPNSINLGSNGKIPVAILSEPKFDATTVDPATVKLAGAGVAIKGKGSRYMSSEEDVNGDGLLDLVLHVETQNLDPSGFQEDGFACLTGETYDGQKVEGWDEIRIVPPD